LRIAGTINRVTTEPAQSPSCEVAPSVMDWGACLTAHEGWLRKVIFARTGEAQAIDELFQRLALVALEKGATLLDPAKAAPWLHRIAVVQSARYRRKLGRERRAVARVADRQSHFDNGYARDALELLLDRERHDRTRQAMLRVSGADAEILLLKYSERWSYRQIADRLGITEKAVDARLLRARARLRRELIGLGIEG
jgi:RNA polymerase sigma-70 factor, ECF subfamily